MTLLQRILLLLLPQRHRAAAEQESRNWDMICDACGHSRSVWDLGGIRWKAKGRRTTRAFCPACKLRGPHHLEKTEPS